MQFVKNNDLSFGIQVSARRRPDGDFDALDPGLRASACPGMISALDDVAYVARKRLASETFRRDVGSLMNKLEYI